MSSSIRLFLLFSVLSGLFRYSTTFAQTSNSLQQQAIALRKVLEKNHYSPRTIDDQLSEQVFRQFIALLDPHHIYFTAADMQELAVYQHQVDDELNGTSWKFLPHISSLYKQRLVQAEKTITDILQKPISFSANETLTLANTDSLNFAADEKAYIQLWHKWLKYQLLKQMVSVPAQSVNAPATTNPSLANEPALRQKVLLIEKRNINRILEHPAGFDNHVGALFFNAFTNCFDPHTNYLSRTEQENFQAALATEGMSFGMDLDENETGDVIIDRLVPGGPAWKSNALHKGDVLLTLQWNGKSAVDLSGADVDDVEEILSASNAGQLEITVRKTNGLVKSVVLVKEIVREEENIVKSLILKGDKKIGYISLPGFYTEWENSSGQGCANDVAKEIVKLKKENIDGLILDIRYNGGGSLMEGINLAGIFINEGPLLLLQGRDGTPTVMKDMNRGTIYDGPLVLMVNGQSASASEVLAATLQDYNRALIVGSPTFGKATGQVILPVDPNNNPSAHQRTKSTSPFGFSAVTIHKLYRITGKSAQLSGVQPDIYLPDMYESLDYREATYPFALPSDSVSKKVMYSPLKALPVKDLAIKSSARMESQASFTTIRKLVNAYRDTLKRKTNTIPLQVTYFTRRASELYQWYESFAKAMEQNTQLYVAANSHFDQEFKHIDSYSKEINEAFIQKTQHDIYIEECYQIINDLLQLQQKPMTTNK